MPEQDSIKDYYTFIRAVFEYATRCWQNQEGRFEVSVSDDKGKVQGYIKGGHHWRSDKAGDGEEG